MSFEGDICKKMTPLNKQTAFKKKKRKGGRKKRERKKALALELVLHPGPVTDANDAP